MKLIINRQIYNENYLIYITNVRKYIWYAIKRRSKQIFLKILYMDKNLFYHFLNIRFNALSCRVYPGHRFDL